MNKNEHAALTKTCTSCGIQKSLTAFLEASGPQGTTYGSICSTCRKTGITTPSLSGTETEDDESTQLKLKLDAKTQIHSDIGKQQIHDKKDENYIEERKENELVTEEKIEVQENIAKSERDHRQSFLNNPTHLIAAKKAEIKRVIETKHKVETETKQFVRKEEAIKEERLTLSVDDSAPIDAQAKFLSPTFILYKSWLGTSSPLVRQADQLRLREEGVKKEKLAAEKSKDPLANYIQKNMRPTPKG